MPNSLGFALDLPWRLDPTTFERKDNVSHGALVLSTVQTFYIYGVIHSVKKLYIQYLHSVFTSHFKE